MRTLFGNATFHTMEGPADVHHSMTVEDGVIVAFDEEEHRGYTFVDLAGAHVFPALIDAHLHLLDSVALVGMGFQICDIEQGRVEPHDLAGVRERVMAQAALVGGNDLIAASNYITSGIAEGRLPNRQELDEWTGGRRVWMENIDGHSAACSTAFLKEVGLLDQAPDGILVGAAHDANIGRVTAAVARSITPRILGNGVASFSDTCASYGIGCVCAMDGTDDLPRDKPTELMAFLAQRMALDVRLFPQYMDEAKIERLLPRMGAKRVGGCMKWELDGSIGSRTAAFAHPFKDGSQGHLYFDDDFLRGKVEDLAQQGYMVSAHAIGELAIEQLTSIYEGLPGTNRIDHCEFPSPDVLPRLYALKPYVTVQPGYAWVDKRYLHGYERWLDPATIDQQVPLRSLVEHGVTLCGSSDSPVQTVDPFLQMRGMREFYVERESLSAYDALCTYTVNGGKMLGERKGVLRRGWEASFMTLDRNLLTVEPAALENPRVSGLYLRGRRYRNQTPGTRGLLGLALRRPRAI